MKFAIIGTGKITERFIDAASGQDIQIEAVLSRSGENGQNYANMHNIPRVFTDICELVESDIDAVYIASPNSCHAAQAIPLLSSGKHVLCEKPMASDLAEGMEMYCTAEKGNAVLLEAMRSVHDPGFVKLQELVKNIGTVRRVQFAFCQYSSRYDSFKNGIVENAFNPELSNAAVMDIGVYCVSPLVRLFGKPEKVTAESVFLRNNMEGMGTALLRYPGMIAEIQYSKITQGYVPNQIQGEDASLLIDAIEDTRHIELVKRNGQREIFSIDKRENNMYYEIETFLELIKAGDVNHPHKQYSLDELETLDRIRKSAGIEFRSI